MISVRDGQNHILAQIERTVPPEIVAIGDALGRVTVDDLQAPFDVPPADNSAVDGYAFASAHLDGARELRVIADLPAGSVFGGALSAGQTVRIMTGAPIPAGADTVCPQELATRTGDRVAVSPEIVKGVNVRAQGEDVRAGTVVVAAGSVLRPQEIGVAASLGPVTKSPSPGGRARPGRSTTPTASRCRG